MRIRAAETGLPSRFIAGPPLRKTFDLNVDGQNDDFAPEIDWSIEKNSKGWYFCRIHNQKIRLTADGNVPKFLSLRSIAIEYGKKYGKGATEFIREVLGVTD